MNQENQMEPELLPVDGLYVTSTSTSTTGDRRRDLVAQAARERLQGVASQSRGVADATRTRMSPYVETAQERLQRSREQLRRRQQQEQEQEQEVVMELEDQGRQRSVPIIPLVIAAIVAVVAIIAFLRSRRAGDEEMDEMDVLLGAGVSLSEMGEPGLLYSDDDLLVAIEDR